MYQQLSMILEGIGIGKMIDIWRHVRAYRRFPELKSRGPNLFPNKKEWITNAMGNVWIHAASVGETQSILPLVQRILNDQNRRVNIVVTCSSPSALLVVEPCERLAHGMLPLDLPKRVDTFLKDFNPDCIIFVESELWPNYIQNARKTGALMVLASAKLSSKSCNRWENYGFDLFRQLLSCFDLIIPRSIEDKKRFERFGSFHMESPVNIKQDVSHRLPMQTKRLCGPAWIAGSIHDEEIEMVVEIHEALCHEHPTKWITILAPRHYTPSMISMIQHRTKSSRVILMSECKSSSDLVTLLESFDKSVLLLVDTLGDLKQLYTIADVAFVGGSLCKVQRDHNMYEPYNAGCRVILRGPVASPDSYPFVELVQNSSALCARVADACFKSPTTDSNIALQPTKTNRIVQPIDHIFNLITKRLVKLN